MNWLWYFIVVIFGSISMHSCANQVSLTGGPRDETPPVLDTIESFKSQQTAFVKSDIHLFFDEFVSLRNPIKQIVISPPLDYIPKVENRGKRVSFYFNEKEELKEDATYVINFGEAIVDFTEGNKLENFTLVFSTGDYIDSLAVSGRIKEVYDGKPAKDVLIMLYETFEDSIIFKERPFYFGKTVEDGTFEIQNLRADTFKVFALRDANLNYLYDPGAEDIGFLDSLIVLNDSSQIKLDLELFHETRDLRYLTYNVLNRGKIEIEFDRDPDLSHINLLDSTLYVLQPLERKGFIQLWYNRVGSTSLHLSFRRGVVGVDTIDMRVNLRNVDPVLDQIEISKINDNGQLGLHPQKELILTFDRPILNINETLITIIDTSKQDSLDWKVGALKLPAMELAIESKWPSSSVVKMTILPGGLVDLFGQQCDTIIRFIQIADESDFGIIRINLSNFVVEGNYLIELMIKDKQVDSRQFLGSEKEISFHRLVPGEYSFRVIDDENRNGIWDPGNYLQKRQSERIYSVSLNNVRENWTMEIPLNLDEMKLENQNDPAKN